MSEPPLINYASQPVSQTPRKRRLVMGFTVRYTRRPVTGALWMAVFAGVFFVFYRSPATALAGWGVSLFLVVIAAACVRAARTQRIAAVLSYFEQAARLHAPLSTFARAAAGAETKRTAPMLLAAADALDAGLPLGDALRSSVPALPLRTADLIRSGELNGSLPATLTRLIAERSEHDTPDRAIRVSFPWAYAFISIVAIVITLTFLLVFVAPKYAEILRDFGRPAPYYWRNVGFGLWALDASWWILATVGLVVAATMFAGSQARWIFLPGRTQEQPRNRYLDRVRWMLPVVGPGYRDRDFADVCQSISDGLARRRPFDAILRDVAAQPHLNEVTLHRLDRWHALVTAGQPVAAAAREARMPTLVSGLIGEHGDAVGTVDTFDFLARHYRTRAIRRGDWLASALMPAMTLLCGYLVLNVAKIAFLPLWTIIDASLPYKVGL